MSRSGVRCAAQVVNARELADCDAFHIERSAAEELIRNEELGRRTADESSPAGPPDNIDVIEKEGVRPSCCFPGKAG